MEPQANFIDIAPPASDAALPTPGGKASIPPVRESPPVFVESSIGKFFASERNFDIDIQAVDIVYAEDEEVFREAAIRELAKAGFLRENIREAENGLEALEHLARFQIEGHSAMPLLVILDVRMPGMDGRECALQIQELVKKRKLRREPFVVCISSIHRQVIHDEGKGNFQVVIPKPFDTRFVEEAIDLMRNWWVSGRGRRLPAWKQFAPNMIDVITADIEPVCNLSVATAFTQAGVDPAAVHDVEQEEDLMSTLQDLQGGDTARPLMVLLGTADWVTGIRDLTDASGAPLRRAPFVVCTSVDSDRISATSAVDSFHAFMPPSFTQKDVRWCIEFCRLWWLSRGDGPDDDEDDEDEDSHSDMSGSEMSNDE